MKFKVWVEIGWGTYTCTIAAVILILVWQLATTIRRFLSRSQIKLPHRHTITTTSTTIVPPTPDSPPPSLLRLSEIITDLDLKSLMDSLDEELHEVEKWDSVIDRTNDSFSYNAKCCKPKDGPLLYLSTTVFEGCSAEILRDFYMDNCYRKVWDKTLIEHEQLEVDESSGTEIGRTIKKFPLLTPREYILAWRLWEGSDGAYYCYSKECEHPIALRQKRCVRVEIFRSGWRIKKEYGMKSEGMSSLASLINNIKLIISSDNDLGRVIGVSVAVPGRNASEIRMVHQEDAGLNIEMAKLIFSKGIWSYMCKMDDALRKYSPASRLQLTSTASAITLVQKVPPVLDTRNSIGDTGYAETSRASAGVSSQVSNERKLSKKPSKKLIANGLLVVGGVICLSRGHSNFSAKVAMAYILSKLAKRRAASS